MSKLLDIPEKYYGKIVKEHGIVPHYNAENDGYLLIEHIVLESETIDEKERFLVNSEILLGSDVYITSIRIMDGDGIHFASTLSEFTETKLLDYIEELYNIVTD